MKRIESIQTFDGKTHKNLLDAERHLKKLYSDKMSNLSNKLMGLKLSQLAETIDAHLKDFVELDKIKADLKLTDDCPSLY